MQSATPPRIACAARNKALDPVEHAVDIAIQPGELVVRIRHGYATTQIAGPDLQRGVSDNRHSVLELTANQRRAPDGEQEGDHASHEKGAHDELLHLTHVMQISADHEHVTVRQSVR